MGSDSEAGDEEEEEEDDYDYTDDFIVKDDDNQEESNSSGDEEQSDEDDNDEVAPREMNSRRRSRVLNSSSSEDGENSNEAADVVAVAIPLVESIVVIERSNPQAEEIVEGKQFATTYLTPEIDEAESSRSSKSPEKADVESVNQSISENQDETKQTNEVEKDATDDDQVENEIVVTSASFVALNEKENEIASKKILVEKSRVSLPGIKRLQNKSITEKVVRSRVSLGDLDPNRCVLRAQRTTGENKKATATITKSDEIDRHLNQSEAEPAVESSMCDAEENNVENKSENANSIVNESMSPSDISSHEENNNEKSTIKGKRMNKCAMKFLC